MTILHPDDFDSIDSVQRLPMHVWGGHIIWVWGLSFRQFISLLHEAQRPGPDGHLHFDPERYALCRVIECVRDGGGHDAQPIFRRDQHYEWLANQDASTIDAIIRRSMELSGETEATLGPDPTAPTP